MAYICGSQSFFLRRLFNQFLKAFTTLPTYHSFREVLTQTPQLRLSVLLSRLTIVETCLENICSMILLVAFVVGELVTRLGGHSFPQLYYFPTNFSDHPS